MAEVERYFARVTQGVRREFRDCREDVKAVGGKCACSLSYIVQYSRVAVGLCLQEEDEGEDHGEGVHDLQPGEVAHKEGCAADEAVAKGELHQPQEGHEAAPLGSHYLGHCTVQHKVSTEALCVGCLYEVR